MLDVEEVVPPLLCALEKVYLLLAYQLLFVSLPLCSQQFTHTLCDICENTLFQVNYLCKELDEEGPARMENNTGTAAPRTQKHEQDHSTAAMEIQRTVQAVVVMKVTTMT